MAWVAVDKNYDEYLYQNEPCRDNESNVWQSLYEDCIELPKGSIKKLIGKELTWEDEAVELRKF